MEASSVKPYARSLFLPFTLMYSVLARIMRTETLCTPPGFADEVSGSAVRMEELSSP
jgi:hypothetical protein